MKRIASIAVGLLVALTISAQQYKQLWITGSAVPGGTQKLVMVDDDDFKYAGELLPGELKIITTKKVGKTTQFLAPVLPDANIVNHGAELTVTDRADAQAWQVVVADGHYRFHVSPAAKRLKGEICQPWGELFIAGGATHGGWKSEGKMLLMKQDADNPFVWTWEGELKAHPEVEEPQSFKFQGQDRWHPKSLHPYRADGDILTDRQLRTGGDDTKWTITEEGIYRITIDLLHETVEAKIINKQK